MRLTVAAAMIGQVLPAAAVAASSFPQSDTTLGASISGGVTASTSRKALGALLGVPSRPVRNGGSSPPRGRRLDRLASKTSEGPVRRLKNKIPEAAVECDPNEDELDTGILSCGFSKYCVESGASSIGGICVDRTETASSASGGELLKNKRPRVFNLGNSSAPLSSFGKILRGSAERGEPCDPTDVGILDCGAESECIAHSASVLGGFCMPETENAERNLQGAAGGLLSTYCGYGSCDCSDVDSDTATGEVVCTGLPGGIFVICNDIVSSAVYTSTFANDALETISNCVTVDNPDTVETCMDLDITNDLVTGCSYSINGEICNSCTVIPAEFTADGSRPCYVFDCTNIDGGLSGSGCYGDAASEALSSATDEFIECYASKTAVQLCSVANENNTDNLYACQCSNFDFNSFTGRINCTSTYSECSVADVGGNLACKTGLYNYELDSRGTSVRQECLSVFEYSELLSARTNTYSRAFCYETSSNALGDLTCLVDDIMCTSCMYGANNCSIFDCANTASMNTGGGMTTSGACQSLSSKLEGSFNMNATLITPSPTLIPIETPSATMEPTAAIIRDSDSGALPSKLSLGSIAMTALGYMAMYCMSV